MDLDKLVTEGRNPETLEIDGLPTAEVLRRINNEDQKVAATVADQLPQIARAVDAVVERLRAGGRLLYFGAGTSGRLGVLDASECPPTFGVSPNQVQGFIAGGQGAMFNAVEGAEDDPALGEADVRANAAPADAVVGIAASGRTPYTLGALRAARTLGCATIALTNNPNSEMAQAADISIAPVVGPEAVMGSTRMKAGTAQKLVLNMLSTAAMIRLGKTFSNLMVDLQPTNAKLRVRAARMVVMATGADPARAQWALEQSGMRPKVAIVMLLAGVGAAEADAALAAEGGLVRSALQRLAPGGAAGGGN